MLLRPQLLGAKCCSPHIFTGSSCCGKSLRPRGQRLRPLHPGEAFLCEVAAVLASSDLELGLPVLQSSLQADLIAEVLVVRKRARANCEEHGCNQKDQETQQCYENVDH